MRKNGLVFLLLAALAAAPITAGELAGVTLPDQVTVGDRDLVLNGMGLREKMWIDVYVAGLYLPAKESDAVEILGADTARHMVMHFVYSEVDAEKLCDGWQDGLDANTPDAPAEVRAQFDTLCGWMETLTEGQVMKFTYLPGEGTIVEVAGNEKGTIEGKPFADALFACWLGPKPPGKGVKQGVLGG